jgi:hypothetical protein
MRTPDVNVSTRRGDRNGPDCQHLSGVIAIVDAGNKGGKKRLHRPKTARRDQPAHTRTTDGHRQEQQSDARRDQGAEQEIATSGGIRLRYQGPVSQLAGSHGAVVEVRARQTDALRAALADHDGVIVDEDGTDRLLITGLDAAAVGRVAFLAGTELQWLAERDGDLERLFFTLTSGTASRDHAGNASEVGV